MVNRAAMMYGQLPHVIDALPSREANEMIAAILDLAEYEREAMDRKPEDIDVD